MSGFPIVDKTKDLLGLACQKKGCTLNKLGGSLEEMDEMDEMYEMESSMAWMSMDGAWMIMDEWIWRVG